MADDEPNERLEDLRRRRAEAVDVLSETLLDMLLKCKRAAREGRTWPPPPPPVPAPRPRRPRTPKGPPKRVCRDLEERDEAAAKALLAATWFPPSELLASPASGDRRRVVLELGRTFVGVGVLDEHGDVGVLRALAIAARHRRQKHGAALAAYLMRLAYEHGLGSVYAAAAVPWFLEEVGFEHIDRVLLPRAARELTGIGDAPASAFLFEMTPSKNGFRRPRRIVPRSLTELLAQSGPTHADAAGPRAARKRQQAREDDHDDAPSSTKQ